MNTTTQNLEETITLEQAQELITEKQTDIMEEADEFANHIIELQEQDNKAMITEDDQNSADELLNSIE